MTPWRRRWTGPRGRRGSGSDGRGLRRRSGRRRRRGGGSRVRRRGRCRRPQRRRGRRRSRSSSTARGLSLVLLRLAHPVLVEVPAAVAHGSAVPIAAARCPTQAAHPLAALLPGLPAKRRRGGCDARGPGDALLQPPTLPVSHRRPGFSLRGRGSEDAGRRRRCVFTGVASRAPASRGRSAGTAPGDGPRTN